MATDSSAVTNYEKKPRAGLSLDVYAVLLAIAVALLVRFNVLQHIGW